MRRLVGAALLVYPRTVRRRHGAELESLVEELIERDGRSRPAVIGRLICDGLTQRLTSATTAWAVAVTLAVTSFGGLAVSDFSAASARQRTPLSSERMSVRADHVQSHAAQRDRTVRRARHRRSAEIIER